MTTIRARFASSCLPFATWAGAEAKQARDLGDLQLLQGVRKFPQRVKCAMLASRAVEPAMAQTAGEATVSTEAES